MKRIINHMTEYLWDNREQVIVGCILGLIIGTLLFGTAGCRLLPYQTSISPSESAVANKEVKVGPITLSEGDKAVVERVIYRMDWLMSGFILCTALGVITGFHGIKSGFLVAGGCIIGAAMKAAFSIVSVYLLSGLIFLAVIMSILIAVSAKKLKGWSSLGPQLKEAFNDVVEKVQDVKKHIQNNLDVKAAQPLLSQVKGILSTEKLVTQELVAEAKEDLKQKAIATAQSQPGVEGVVRVQNGNS